MFTHQLVIYIIVYIQCVEKTFGSSKCGNYAIIIPEHRSPRWSLVRR